MILSKLQNKAIDMTQGGIVRNLALFSLPLLAGNLFQQLYNMVDTWVIGQTGVPAAYAAVGSIGPIINILIGFFLGLATGAGVIISQYFGAKDDENLHRSVRTALTLTLLLSVFVTLAGVFGAPLMLRLMLGGEESEVFEHAKTYLTIYFAGVAGLMVYNMGSGILRAVGDSRRPFLFLVIAALVNTALDLVFVFGFQMGVAGVALATVIAQFVSAGLTLLVLLRAQTAIRIGWRDLRLDREVLGRIARVGLPSALQMSVTSFSNVFVQGYIAGVNGDQTLALAAWTSYSKIEQIIFLPIQSVGVAATTFVGQNIGVRDFDRARRGTRTAYLMATCSAALLIGLVEWQAPQLVRLFLSEPSVVDASTRLVRTLVPFYFCSCVNQVYNGALKGAGNARAPMLIMIGSFVVFRQIYLFVVSRFIANELLYMGLSYPAGWLLCATVTLIYYHRYSFELASTQQS